MTVRETLGSLREFGDWLRQLPPPPRTWWGGYCPLEQFLVERGAGRISVFPSGIYLGDDEKPTVTFSAGGPYRQFVDRIDNVQDLWDRIPTSDLVDMWSLSGGDL